MMKISYRNAQKSDIESIAKLQADTFLKREPMTMALKLTYEEYYEYLVKIFKELFEISIIFIAIDEKNGNTVGMSFNVDMMAEIDDAILTKREMEATLLSNSMFALFNDEISNLHIKEHKDTLYLSYASIDENYLRLGIAENLLRNVFIEASKQGYKYMLGYPTNIKSQKMLNKFGFTKLKGIHFKGCNIVEFSNINEELALCFSQLNELKI